MVQEKSAPVVYDIKVESLSGVDAAARLQSRGNVSDNNIFEIVPRFSISAGEDNKNWNTQYSKRKDDVFTVTGTGDVTGVLVGCELMIFERDKDEPLKQLRFGASVDFVVWRRSILLIGLSSSEIILVDPNTYATNFSWRAVPDLDGRERFFVDAFIHSNSDPTKIDVIVVSRDGLVCTFRDIALSSGTLDATHDQNVSLDVDLGSIKDISRHTLTISSKISCACSPTRNNIIVIEETGNILIVDLISNVENFYPVSNIFFNIYPLILKSCVTPKKVAVFEGTLFLLLSNGLLQICVDSDAYISEPLVLPVGFMVHDFALVRNNNEETVKLWVLYSSSSTSCMDNFLGIFGGPTFTSEFNFQLPVFTKTGDSSLFKFSKNVSPFEEPTTVVEMAPNNVFMYKILETSTDVTLQKLLSRGKYLEAEDLAIGYNKDLDIVRKAEARDKLSKINSVYTSDGMKSLDTLWLELLAILEKINDAAFVCNFCVEAQLHRVDWVKEILNVGKARVQNCTTQKASNLLLLTLKKFFTFELVYPCGTINEWKAFVSMDNTMFLQSMKFLHNSNFEKCERIWKRHWEEFISAISLMEFLPIFNVLFDHQLRTSESISLFKTVFPYSVEKVAQIVLAAPQKSPTSMQIRELDVLIEIIQRQIFTLESRIEWPVNALKFIKVLGSIIKDEMKKLELSRNEQVSVMNIKKVIVRQMSIELDSFEQILEELAELKRNHSIRILFQDYTSNEIPEVVNKLLYKLLSQDEVESFVIKYLRPYAQRKGLNIDNLFAEHIKSVLQYIHYYIQAFNIPHEERIICLVNLISSTKTKLESALLISQEWPVPWTIGIANMIDRIIDSTRTALDSQCACLYDSIVLMKKQVPYRCVMNKYKLSSSKLCSRRSYIPMALLKIIKLKNPGFREDCLELLKHVPSKTLIDGVHLEYLEVILRMDDIEIHEDDVIPDDMILSGNLKRALMQRTFVQLQKIEEDKNCVCYSQIDQERFLKIYRLVGNESTYPRNSVMCKLKDILPSMRLNLMYDPGFPYVCVCLIFEGSNTCIKDSAQLFKNCKELSCITETYISDLLIAAGAYFVPDGLKNNPCALSQLWSIVEFIVNTPLKISFNNSSVNRELLQDASLQIAHVITLQYPDASLKQMYWMQEFLCCLSRSFDKICFEVSHLLCFLRIFLSLKEQEIPLEKEFLEIYKWLCGGHMLWDVGQKTLKYIGETLLKFGETDLFFSVIKLIHRSLQTFITELVQNHNTTAANYYQTILIDINNFKDELRKRALMVDDDVEPDSHMIRLVQDLNDAGIRVNEYALKIRNKVKLLERLLNSKTYVLAAKLAITFNFYDDHKIWSKILEGLVMSGTLEDLRQVLERIGTVPQLWMLPEFTHGWKRVSEVDNSFLDLCPIPLV